MQAPTVCPLLFLLTYFSLRATRALHKMRVVSFVYFFICLSSSSAARSSSRQGAGLDWARLSCHSYDNQEKMAKKKYKLWQMGANFNEIQQRKANKVNEESASETAKGEMELHSLSLSLSLTHTFPYSHGEMSTAKY